MKVLIGMSGGVDSSVSAAILCEKGYEVVGATLDLLESDSSEMISDAKKVANQLNIPHIVLDFKEEFSLKVKEYFANEYLKGRTPNPCAMCNKKIKFGLMLDYALSHGFTHIATGHYVRILKKGNEWAIQKNDSHKDQSYFLYKLNQHQLSHIIFPLAELKKEEVREIAKKYNLIVASKKESQDICFVKDETHADFIKRYKNMEINQGNILDIDHKVVGIHKGIINYTVGQRRHLGVALGFNAYVLELDAEKNTITLGKKEYGRFNGLIATDPHFISEIPFKSPIVAFAKLRSRAKEVKCTIYVGEKLKVVFDESVYFPAPGQSIVFYDKEGYVLGGGIIEHGIHV